MDLKAYTYIPIKICINIPLLKAEENAEIEVFPKAGAGFQRCLNGRTSSTLLLSKEPCEVWNKRGSIYFCEVSLESGSWECCYELMYENQGTDSSAAL